MSNHKSYAKRSHGFWNLQTISQSAFSASLPHWKVARHPNLSPVVLDLSKVYTQEFKMKGADSDVIVYDFLMSVRTKVDVFLCLSVDRPGKKSLPSSGIDSFHPCLPRLILVRCTKELGTFCGPEVTLLFLNFYGCVYFMWSSYFMHVGLMVSDGFGSKVPTLGGPPLVWSNSAAPQTCSTGASHSIFAVQTFDKGP